MTPKEKLKFLIAEKKREREKEKSQPKKHFVLIKDFNQFMFNFSNHKTKKYFCMHCLQCFYSEEHLENHKEDCLLINGTQKIEMPPPGSKVYFKNHEKQLPVPFVIMLILKLSPKRSPLVLHLKKSPILKLIKRMKPRVLVKKWFVITIRNILNQPSFIEVKMSLRNSSKICLRKSKIVKK